MRMRLETPNQPVEDNAPPAASAMVIGFMDRSFLFRGWRFQRVPHLLRSAKPALP
jgi:hypothetical protein